jgi:hypothetical protein
MTPEERERLSISMDKALDGDTLKRFLAGPSLSAKGAPEPPQSPAPGPAYNNSTDPANIQRRRWGVGAAIEKPTSTLVLGRTEDDSAGGGGASWWQKTSWFAGGAPDVAPVLGDPTVGPLPRARHFPSRHI